MDEPTASANVPDIPVRTAIRVRAASASDARQISGLIRNLSTPFLLSPGGEGAEPFFASISESAIRGYIAAANFQYLVAEADSAICGVVALRDSSHLFHLFVAPEFQRQGLARKLWHLVRDIAFKAGNASSVTVNASLISVPVYERFGFVPSGPKVEMHGVAFVPMGLVANEGSVGNSA